MKKIAVSFLVPIKNETANLPRCLGSIQWADEIIVVDSHSTDGSAAIAEEHNAHVVQFDFNGRWPKKKKLGSGKYPLQTRMGFHSGCR